MSELTHTQIREFIEVMSGLKLRDVAITSTAEGVLLFQAIAKFHDRDKAITISLTAPLDAVAMELRRLNEDEWGPSA